jgi:hypothetical protein
MANTVKSTVGHAKASFMHRGDKDKKRYLMASVKTRKLGKGGIDIRPGHECRECDIFFMEA